MTFPSLTPRLGVMISAALLTITLGWLVVDRVMLVKTGREVVLPIRPVDPRDLFKGDYARLAFDLSCEPQSQPSTGRRLGRSNSTAPAIETVYVTLARQPDNCWKQIAVDHDRPKPGGADQVVMRGRARYGNLSNIAFGIERYYVPEGTGREFEDLARQSKLSAIVAVDKSGRSAIKGLVVDGKKVYEEPMF